MGEKNLRERALLSYLVYVMCLGEKPGHICWRISRCRIESARKSRMHLSGAPQPHELEKRPPARGDATASRPV